jgi:hypothetical protein
MKNQIDISKLKPGDSVRYVRDNAPESEFENGIVKEVVDNGVRVVYHCANEWANYMDYTSALTRPENLRLGWG